MARPVCLKRKALDPPEAAPNDASWESVHHTLAFPMGSLGQLDPDLFTDITLRVKREAGGDECLEVPCHRIILAMSSPVFKAMLTSEMMESREKVIQLYERDVEAVGNLIQAMYHRPLTLTMRGIIQLCKAAAKYEVIPVTTHCLNIVKEGLTISSVGEVFDLTASYPFEDLREACVKKVREDDKQMLTPKDRSKYWRQLPFELVLELVKSDDLELSEVAILQRILWWIFENKPQKGEGEELLRCVRFEHFSAEVAKSTMKVVSSPSSSSFWLPYPSIIEGLIGEGYVRRLKGTMRKERGGEIRW